MNYEEFLKNKLGSIFVEESDRQRATQMLETYGLDAHEQEPSRVRLAILKLAGSDLAEIEKMTRCAKQDFRDILSWAEYPRQAGKWSMRTGPERQRLAEAERQEYLQWLNT